MAMDFLNAFNGILLSMVDNPAYLIFLIIGILMIPLSLFGILHLYSWIDTWSKLKSGWIKVRKKLSNGRWVTFWARPTGRKIKIKGEEGMEYEVPVQIEKGMMGYESYVKGKWVTQEEADLHEEEENKSECKKDVTEEKENGGKAKKKFKDIDFKLTPEQIEILRNGVKNV